MNPQPFKRWQDRLLTSSLSTFSPVFCYQTQDASFFQELFTAKEPAHVKWAEFQSQSISLLTSDNSTKWPYLQQIRTHQEISKQAYQVAQKKKVSQSDLKYQGSTKWRTMTNSGGLCHGTYEWIKWRKFEKKKQKERDNDGLPLYSVWSRISALVGGISTTRLSLSGKSSLSRDILVNSRTISTEGILKNNNQKKSLIKKKNCCILKF